MTNAVNWSSFPEMKIVEQKHWLPVKWLLLIPMALLLFFFATNLSAQTTDSLASISVNPEKQLKKINLRQITHEGFNFWEDDFSGHWAGLHAGLNSFISEDYTGYSSHFMESKLIHSTSIYLNPIQQSIGLQRNKNTIGLVTGLGIEWKSYRLNTNTTIEKGTTGRIEPKILLFDDNQKSKFNQVYLTSPLLAEFQLPVRHYKNRMFLSAGIMGAYRLSSATKIIYRLDRKREKLKTPGDFYLPDFRASLMARAGYRNIQFFAICDLQPLFKKGKGPELTPVSVGITLISF